MVYNERSIHLASNEKTNGHGTGLAWPAELENEGGTLLPARPSIERAVARPGRDVTVHDTTTTDSHRIARTARAHNAQLMCNDDGQPATRIRTPALNPYLPLLLVACAPEPLPCLALPVYK
jgi:hypothetical protein